MLGVFAATQVANWNSARAERAHADYLVTALHAVFKDIEGELARINQREKKLL